MASAIVSSSPPRGPISHYHRATLECRTPTYELVGRGEAAEGDISIQFVTIPNPWEAYI